MLPKTGHQYHQFLEESNFNKNTELVYLSILKLRDREKSCISKSNPIRTHVNW